MIGEACVANYDTNDGHDNGKSICQLPLRDDSEILGSQQLKLLNTRLYAK